MKQSVEYDVYTLLYTLSKLMNRLNQPRRSSMRTHSNLSPFILRRPAIWTVAPLRIVINADIRANAICSSAIYPYHCCEWGRKRQLTVIQSTTILRHNSPQKHLSFVTELPIGYPMAGNGLEIVVLTYVFCWARAPLFGPNQDFID